MPKEERPQQYIIENDTLLDFWLQDYLSKKKRDNKYNRLGKQSKNVNSIKF